MLAGYSYFDSTQLSDLLARSSGARASSLIYETVENSMTVATDYVDTHQYLLYELTLRKLFNELLDVLCDSLISHHIRHMCLDQIYKPLLALKKYYRSQHGHLAAYYKLEHELRVLSFEFLQYKGES